MADPTTTNIVLNVPTTGSDSGTWGTSLNNNFNALDAIFGTVTTTSLTNANVTLNTSQTQASILRFTGTLSGNVIITLGAIIKPWIFENNTTGAFTVTVKGNPGTGNVIALPPGSCQAYWDGTNMNFLNLGKIGEYWDYSASSVPAWVGACTVPPYLNCDGTTFSAVTYPLLNAILGGNTLPDSRGRFRATINQGTGRISNFVSGDVLAAVGGSDTSQLISSNLPAYTPSGTISLTLNGGQTFEILTGTLNGSGASLSTGFPASMGSSLGIGSSWTSGGGAFLPAGTFTGSAQGGSSSIFSNTPPTYIGGITMIRAA